MKLREPRKVCSLSDTTDRRSTLLLQLVVEVEQSCTTKLKSKAVNTRLRHVLLPTDRGWREGNQWSIDTSILQTSHDMWLTVAIHVIVGHRDPVRIPISFRRLRLLGMLTTSYPYIQELFKLTHESAGAMATQHMQRAGVDWRMLKPRLGPATYGVMIIRAISSSTRSIQDGKPTIN